MVASDEFMALRNMSDFGWSKPTHHPRFVYIDKTSSSKFSFRNSFSIHKTTASTLKQRREQINFLPFLFPSPRCASEVVSEEAVAPCNDHTALGGRSGCHAAGPCWVGECRATAAREDAVREKRQWEEGATKYSIFLTQWHVGPISKGDKFFSICYSTTPVSSSILIPYIDILGGEDAI